MQLLLGLFLLPVTAGPIESRLRLGRMDVRMRGDARQLLGDVRFLPSSGLGQGNGLLLNWGSGQFVEGGGMSVARRIWSIREQSTS